MVQHNQLKDAVAAHTETHEKLLQEQAQLMVGREPSVHFLCRSVVSVLMANVLVQEARDEKMARLNELRGERMQIEEEMKKYADNDPALLEALEGDIKTAIDSANRWTGKRFLLVSSF